MTISASDPVFLLMAFVAGMLVYRMVCRSDR